MDDLLDGPGLVDGHCHGVVGDPLDAGAFAMLSTLGPEQACRLLRCPPRTPNAWPERWARTTPAASIGSETPPTRM
ncbi:hypothetical protein Drose_06765 [Dactylosporangium roseum]|uniref:Uncharacterized protein n=1 Tax=Dactylosporangium roseum TaxID=47989 RepID=A0ABY5Z8I7_9ACTN|nr:hypothetical protein [Dactylosporangium roseum]UWZ37969.1 hypothetical protein Drose_06765 [Dactylosporangium roseum]